MNKSFFSLNVKQAGISLSVFALLFFAYSKMSFGENIPNMSAVAAISLIVFILLTLRIRRDLNVMDISVIAMLLIMYLWNNWDFKIGQYLTIFGHTVFFLFYIFASRNGRWINTAFRFSIFVGVFYAVWTIVTWLSPDIYYGFVLPIVEGKSVYNLSDQYRQGFMPGFTSHYSTNGLYLSCGICFTLGYYFFNGVTSKKNRVVGWILLLTQIFALLLTGKRGPILFLVAAFYVTYMVYNADKPLSRYVRIIGIALAAIIGFAIAASAVPQLQNFVIRFVAQVAAGDVSNHRFDLWNQAWEGFLKSPILGNGWYWYCNHNISGYHAHNCYLQWLCEVGIIGSIPFFYFSISTYVESIKLLRKVRKEKMQVDRKEYLFISIPVLYQTFFALMCFTGTAFIEIQSFCPYILCCAFVRYISSTRSYMTKYGR